MEYRIEQLLLLPSNDWTHNGAIGRCYQIIQRREEPGAQWSILVGGQALWNTSENAEAYLTRWKAEKDAACARAALGVTE